MSPTKAQLNLYAQLMEEVKVRLGCMGQAQMGRTGLPPPIVREFGYLQLRLLCEVIAVACLVAHGDITDAHAISRNYSADDIIKGLTKLRPHFYPFACVQAARTDDDGKRHFTLTALQPQPLPKEDLLALYGRCHAHLHRGSMKGFTSASTPTEKPSNLPEIDGWARKIAMHLQVHTIAISEEFGITCILQNSDDSGRVQVASYRLG